MSEKMNLTGGGVTFYDHAIPSLPGGEFTITVSQEVTLPDDGKKEFRTEGRFRVAAPQFRLEPADIYACFPPPGSKGDFHEILPQIVFTKRIIPWARPLGPETPKQVPWLALLLFTKDELPGENPNGANPGTIGDLLAPAPGVLIPPVTIEGGVHPGESCQYIEITPETFTSLVPGLDELPYLAHRRAVNTADKAILNMKHQGDFAVVLGNRLPRVVIGGETRYIAHLVSLEGFTPYITDRAQLTKYDRIRLISLARWNFISVAGQEDDLRKALLHLTGDGGERLLFRLAAKIPEEDGAAAVVQRRLTEGYVPLPYHLSTGGDTFAWYRGPFTPASVKPLVNAGPFLSAAAAMIYDEPSDSLDLSLAVARQMGESLALADRNFVFALRRFNQKGHRAVDTVFGRTQSRIYTGQKTGDLAALGKLEAKAEFTRKLDQNLAGMIQNMHRDLPPPTQTSTFQTVAVSPDEKGSDYLENLNTFYERDDLRAYLGPLLRVELEEVANWLCELYLLYKVSFTHLVPHPDLLPEESIRFFHVDENWLEALMDGALGTGLQSGRDERLYHLIKSEMSEQIRHRSGAVRNKIRGCTGVEPEATGDGLIPGMSGMFIRSKAVANWPGLEIIAFGADGNQLPLRRLDHLTSEIMLVLYAGVPHRIVFQEPAEGISLKLGEFIVLRKIDGEEAGKKLGEYPTQGLIKPNGVLDLGRLIPGLQEALRIRAEEFGPGAFAMLLLTLPRQFIMNRMKGMV